MTPFRRTRSGAALTSQRTAARVRAMNRNMGSRDATVQRASDYKPLHGLRGRRSLQRMLLRSRVHFHAFMLDVHARLAAQKKARYSPEY